MHQLVIRMKDKRVSVRMVGSGEGTHTSPWIIGTVMSIVGDAVGIGEANGSMTWININYIEVLVEVG